MSIKKKTIRVQGQAMIEFTFGMVVAILLLMGMVQVLVWTGLDLANRRLAHEQHLTRDAHGINQTEPIFYHSSPIFGGAASNVFGDEFLK